MKKSPLIRWKKELSMCVLLPFLGFFGPLFIPRGEYHILYDNLEFVNSLQKSYTCQLFLRSSVEHGRIEHRMTDSEKRHHFEEEYSANFDAIYRFVRFRIPHHEEAEDRVSAIFMKAFEKIQEFNPERGTLIQWLMGIAKHAVVDYWRSRRITLDLDETLLLMKASKHTASDAIDESLLFEKIMGALPAEARALFALRYIDDLTYEEIAKLTHKSPEAISKWFSRLHKRLRMTTIADPSLS